jgi:hypothetical protein
MATQGLTLQYQALTQAPPALLTIQYNEGAWHRAWTDPVRVKIDPRLAIALMASGPNVWVPQAINPKFYESPYHFPWSEPVRLKPGLGAHLQSFFTRDTSVLPQSKTLEWFAQLSEPVRLKPGLRPAYVQDRTDPISAIPNPGDYLDAFQGLSTPVRLPIGLMAQLQQFLAQPPRELPTAAVAVTISATEVNSDVANFAVVVSQSVGPATATIIANVSVVEIQAIAGGFASIERTTP